MDANKMKKIFFTLVFSLFSINANAQFFDGNKLLTQLESTKSDERYGALMYIIGAFDMINEIDILANKESKNYMFCQPQNMNGGQLGDIVKMYLQRNPSIRHLPAAELIVQALRNSFPCKRSENTQPSTQRRPDRTL